MGSMNDPKEARDVAVVMVPLPAQGHLNPFLHLSHRIACRGIDVHYVGSATHNRQARARLHGWDLAAAASHLHFHDLPFPSSSLPHNPAPSTNFPSHLQSSFDAAATHLLPHLSSLLRSLSPSYHRITLLHDSCMTFASPAASSIPNAEPFAFHPASAISNLFFNWLLFDQVNPNPLFTGLSARNTISDYISEEFLSFVRRQLPMRSTDAGRLFNTCRIIEGDFLDCLSNEKAWEGQSMFAIGPLNPVSIPGRSQHECLSWLDLQPLASVVYVSFGTTSSLSKEQVRELAAGLDASEQRFIWVRRDSDGCDIFEGGKGEEDLEVLEFEKRVEGRGKVVRGWAPQLEILAHPATGGFLSHCGWNSCMEAMSNGVPILTWPMHSDQPANTVLVTEVLRTGIAVRDWAEREEVAVAGTVKEAIVRLMAGGEGSEVRRRAKEIGEKLRAAVVGGGSSSKDLEAFLNYISRP